MFLSKIVQNLALIPIFQTKNRNFSEKNFDEGIFDWSKNARENQKLPQGQWKSWVILAGRGFGKTRTGAESVRALVDSAQSKRIALIGQTMDEAKNVMVAGVSGILAVYPPNDPNYPKFESSKYMLTWPNGAIAQIFGADHYDCLRGPQFDLAWVDEFAKFRYPEKTYEQIMLCLRLGEPRCIITTTPRPLLILQEILDEPQTVKTKGTTFDNVQNLSQKFVDFVKKRYGSNSFGRQELYGDLIFENPDALWKHEFIPYIQPSYENFVRIVVAVDPAVTYGEQSDETGIIVIGRCSDGMAYVLDDASGRYAPSVWGAKVVEKYHEFQADRVVAEVNQGGDLVAEMIKSFDRSIPYTAVRASRGKIARAEPIAALYEQGKIAHVRAFQELEAQMCEYVPDFSGESRALGRNSRKSPDRMDALVWGATELFHADLTPPIRIWG
ncbi:MAG: terminase family protein [Holosporales bacterium]|jgi:predicted phage terminase large subunit-like protein|nr:terminase family protein [Holosporales bacterium]